MDDGFKNTKQVFDELCIDHFTEEDCRIAQYVCSLVSTRAAYLASAGKYIDQLTSIACKCDAGSCCNSCQAFTTKNVDAAIQF